MRALIIFIVGLYGLHASNLNTIYGKWHSIEETNNQGTVTIEKEYLHLNEDKTFSILVFVSVQKGDAFIKDLRIEEGTCAKSYFLGPRECWHHYADVIRDRVCGNREAEDRQICNHQKESDHGDEPPWDAVSMDLSSSVILSISNRVVKL